MSSGNHLPNLDKIFRDDEEPDFLPSGGSNLASIFGMQSKGSDVGSSVKHAPQKKANSGHSTPQPVTLNKPDIIAKAVHTYKLSNGHIKTYVPVGKLGMALVGNTLTRTYQIILYNSKQEHLSTVTLTHDFSYTVQPNNYTSYYDSNNDNWSILFENNEACVEFAREVALARYFLKEGKTENIFYQNLTVAADDVLAKEGDNVTVKYYIAPEIRQPFKSIPFATQTMTVNISTDDNWERNLLDTSRGLKRILFLPPSKQISLGPGFPKETDVMLEIEITDISPSEQSSLSPKQGVSGRASLLSRMARMGQSMIPKLPIPATTDSEDTEDDVPQRSPRHKKVESSESLPQKKTLPQESGNDVPRNSYKVIKPRNEVPLVDTNINRLLVSASTLTSQWSPTQIPSNFITADGHLYTPAQQPIQTIVDPSLNMFMSEMRITNAEVRMGMSKINDNVQKLLDKFHVFELQNAATSSNDRSIESTLKTLFDNVKYNEKVPLPNRVDDDKITALEIELKKTQDMLLDKVDPTNDTEERKRLEKINLELTEKIAELAVSVNKANVLLKKTTDDLERAKNIAAERDKDNLLLSNRISQLTNENETLKLKTAMTEQKDHNDKNKEIKYIMNKAYHTLMETFVDESYPTRYIKSTIGSVIKNITLQVLHGQSQEDSSNDAQSNVAKFDTEECRKSISSSTFSSTETNEQDISKPNPRNTVLNIMPVQDEPPPFPPFDVIGESEWC